MTDIVVTGLVSAVVVGIVEGWRRVGAAAEVRTQRLGRNLGPRVEDLLGRVAYLEGRAGIRAPKSPAPATLEHQDADDGRPR